MARNKLRLVFVFLTLGIFVIALTSCRGDSKSEYQKLLDRNLKNSKVAAVGEPTNKFFDYTQVALRDFKEEDYCAIFIFPSAVDEILKDRELRYKILFLSCPVVVIDEKKIYLSQLYLQGESKKSKNDRAGDVQIWKLYKEGKERETQYYDTSLNSKTGGYGILADYIITFNKYKLPSEADKKYYQIDKDVKGGDYKSIYKKRKVGE